MLHFILHYLCKWRFRNSNPFHALFVFIFVHVVSVNSGFICESSLSYMNITSVFFHFINSSCVMFESFSWKCLWNHSIWISPNVWSSLDIFLLKNGRKWISIPKPKYVISKIERTLKYSIEKHNIEWTFDKLHSKVRSDETYIQMALANHSFEAPNSFNFKVEH